MQLNDEPPTAMFISTNELRNDDSWEVVSFSQNDIPETRKQTMGWTVSSESIPHGQKQAFIYMLVNGIEIEDYEHDDYFASYRLLEDTIHLFQGLHPGLYLISYTKIHSFMNLIRKRENEMFRVNVMYDHLDYDSPYKCGNYVFDVSRKESLDVYNEMEKKVGNKGDKDGIYCEHT